MSQAAAESLSENITKIIHDVLLDEVGLTNGTNETAKFQATPEGLGLAYSSLLLMALLPIIIGSFKSVKHQKKQQESGEQVEIMSTKEALMFPVIASCTLFGIYIVFQIFSKEYINLLLAFYFFALGVVALTRTSHPFLAKYFKCSFFDESYDLKVSFKTVKKNENIFMCDSILDRQLIMSFLLSLGIGVWYILKKHWIANNIFGLAFSINGIEFLQLNKVKNGCILLGGLFFYDVFWVFGTNVMVSVAKSFDAPIKLIFPQDLLENFFDANKFAILGLGDIVIPGIFIALLLRFDNSLNRGTKVYFYSSFIAYILALVMTIFVMHVFKHAQPALLYIVPLCLVVPLTIALLKGDLKTMFQYEDHEEKSLNDSTISTASTTSAGSANESSSKDKKSN